MLGGILLATPNKTLNWFCLNYPMKTLSPILFFKRSPGYDIKEISLTKTKKKKKTREIYYLCKFCKTKITSSRYKIKVNGKFKHLCANPHGILFEIGCFSHGTNYVPASKPTEEFTWFKGYAWQIIVCINCLNHLGWIYTLGDSSFLGLILTNLVEENSVKP